MAISGGPAAIDHERRPPEEQNGDQASRRESDGVVDHPVALDGIADLELHDGDAGEAGLEAGSGQIGVQRVGECRERCRSGGCSATASGSSARTISVSLPSFESSLPRIISFDVIRSTSC